MLSRPLLTALVAGLISATGFAPLNLWPVTLLAFAVLLWLTWSAPTLKSVLLRGWVFGVGHFTVGNNWIQHAFDYQDKMPPVLGYFAVVLLALYLAVYPAVAMGLAWRFARLVKSRAGWEEADLAFVLSAAASWIVTEYLRGVLFTGFPWNLIGSAWARRDHDHLGLDTLPVVIRYARKRANQRGLTNLKFAVGGGYGGKTEQARFVVGPALAERYRRSHGLKIVVTRGAVAKIEELFA